MQSDYRCGSFANDPYEEQTQIADEVGHDRGKGSW
jgi:hypothetical protein